MIQAVWSRAAGQLLYHRKHVHKTHKSWEVRTSKPCKDSWLILDCISIIIFGNNKPQNSHSSSKQQRGWHKCLLSILRPQNMYQHIIARNRLPSQTWVKQRSEEKNIYRPKNLQPLPNVTTARIACPSRFVQWEYIDAIRVVKADQCRSHKSRRTWIRSEDLATCASQPESQLREPQSQETSNSLPFTSYSWKTKRQNENAIL